MSQNVPALAVLLLLCAPGLIGSEAPHPTNVPQTGSSYQDKGTGAIQDRNTRSSVTNLMPVYPISNRQNAHSAVQETFHDFRSNHRAEPQKIPTYVIRPPQTTRLKTILAHGSSSPEMDGLNPPRPNSAFRVGSTNQMISSLATAERNVTSDLPIPVRGEPNKIPIYVIRPPYPGMASPTLVNMAVLPQEQINPDIIRILQSLGVSQDRVPLVLVTGSIPSLNVDAKIDTQSGINTLDFGFGEGRSNPMMSMIAPYTSSKEEWYDEEMMKQETLIHGKIPSSFPNLRRFGQVSPQLYVKPGVPHPAYRLPGPVNHQNMVPMNTEHFSVLRGRNGLADFLPAQQNTPPRTIMPQDDYQPTEHQVSTGFSDSLRYDPVPQTRIPDYPIVDGQESPYASETLKKSFPNHPTQHPQYPRPFIPSLQQEYASTDDHQDLSLRQQYLPYPSSDVKESLIPPYPSQLHPHSSLYNNQAPYDFQTPSSPVFPSSDVRVPSIQDQREVISQIGRLTVPETPSQYPLIHPKDFTEPEELYPGQQKKYPFIQKIPRGNLKNPSYPYFPGMDVFNTPERPHLTPQHKYPQYPPIESEDLRNHRNPQPVYSSQPLHSPPHSQSPDYTYHPSPQYPSRAGKQLPEIQPRPIIHTQIEELAITEKPQQIPPEPYSKFPFAREDTPSDYHTSFPHQIHPKQKPMHPSGGKVPFFHPNSPTSIQTTSDEEEPNTQSTPDLLAGIGKIEVPGLHTDPYIGFLPYAPTPYPKDTFPQQEVPGQLPQRIYESPLPQHLNQIPQDIPQYPSTDTDDSGSGINTLDLPSDQQPEFSPDGQSFGYPRKDISPYTHIRQPSMSPRIEVLSDMKKFDIPEKFHPRPQQKYPQHPSSGTGESTNLPEKSADQTYQYSEYPSDGRVINYPKQPADDEEPLMRPRIDIDTGITKLTVSEPISFKPHQKYPQFPSTINDEPTSHYPDTGSRQPHPHFPSDGQLSGYPRQPIGETEPQKKRRTDVFSEMERFSIPEQPYPKPQQKYLDIPSSDTDEPTYYPDSPHGQTYKGTQPDFQPDGQVPSYPRQPMDETEPQVGSRPEIVSNIETFSIPEQPYTMPQQKYPYIPSSDTDEPTYYPDSHPRQPYKGTHPDFLAHGQVASYPRQPMDETEPQLRPRPDIVSNIEKFNTPEQTYPMPQQGYPLIPSSGTDEPAYYPDSGPQQLYKGRRPDFPYAEEVTGYTKTTADDPEQQRRPPSEVVSKIGKFSIPERPYPATQQKHPHIPSPGSDEPAHYPDSGPQQPGQRPDFSHIGLVASYPKHPVDDTDPQMRPIPDVNSNLGRIDIPEQPFSKSIQQSPQFPYSDADEPTYYPDSVSRQPYKGTHPDFPSDGQVSGYPRPPMDDKEPPIKPRTDFVSEIEKFSVTELPYSKPQQKYPHVPSPNINEPGNYPDSGPRQPYEGTHPDLPPNGQLANYPRMDETKPQIMRPRHEIVSNIEKLGLHDQPYPVPQQVYPQLPSSDTNEPSYYADRGPQQLQIGKHPDFSSDSQVPVYPRQPMDDTEPQMRFRPNVVSEVEKLSVSNQPYQKPQQKYPHNPSSDYFDSVPQQPGNQLADFPSHGQDARFPKKNMDDTEKTSRPIPDIVSNMETFNIPAQPYPIPQPKFRQLPSSDTEEPTKYPEIIPQERNEALYPEIPAYGQIPGYPKQDTDRSEQMTRPRPVVVSELNKFDTPGKPHMKPHQRYPEQPSSDTDDTRKYLDRRPQPHTDQQPEPASDGQISSYPVYPSGYQDTSLRPRPETLSQIEKFHIPEEHYLKPQQEYPRYPSSETDESIYHTDSSMQQPYGQYPESDYRTQVYPKQPVDNAEPMMRPRPEIVSEINKFNIPQEPHPMSGKNHPQYPSRGTDALGEGPKPSYTEQQSWFPPDSHIAGQHHPQYPPTHSENPLIQAIQPRPNVPAEIERLYITENPQLGKTEKYPRYPSVYLDAIQKSQSLDQQPTFQAEIPVPMSYPVSSHPYFGKELLIKPMPNVQSQIRKFDVPTGENPQHPSTGSHEPDEPYKPREQTPLPYDTEFSTETPSQYNPMHASAGSMWPSLRPEIVSHLGRFNVSEPNIIPQNRYPQSPPKGTFGSTNQPEHQQPLSFDQQTQSTYQNLVPSYENQGFPQYPSINGEEPSWQPRPEVRVQFGETVTSEKTLIKPDMHGPVQNLNTFPQEQFPDHQPQWLPEGVSSIDYPDQFAPQYPPSSSEPPSIRPYSGPQTKRFDFPKSSGSALEPQYPGLKQPRFDNQLPNQEPQFPTDISVSTQSQQDIPQYPPFDDKRIPERPDIVSKIFNIPETPELRNQQNSPQYVSSDTNEPVHYDDPYPQQVPLGQQHPSSLESYLPGIYSPQQPPSTDMSPSFLPLPNFTAQIERIHIPEQQKSLEEDYPQYPSMGNLEPRQRPSTSPQQMPDTPIQQPLLDAHTSSPDLSGSASSPLVPRTPGREPEPEKQAYPKENYISPTLDIAANVERFRVPEGSHFRPSGQEYLPKDGILPQRDTHGVPGLDLRPSNDIDINIDRLTVPGQMPWQPEPRYPQYISSDMQKPDEYTETYPLHPDKRPQTQMKPDDQLPVGGDRLPENAYNYPSSSQYRPLQQPLYPSFPKEPFVREHQEYPHKYIDAPSNQPRPRVTAEVERLSLADHPHLLPIRMHPHYPSTDDESPQGSPDYELEYPPERQVPHSQKLLSPRYPLADQGLPMKQLRPDIQMRMERVITQPPVLPLTDERFQSLYTTTTSTTQKPRQVGPQFSPAMTPNYLSQYYSDSVPSQINRPHDQTKTDIEPIPTVGQDQFPPYYKKTPESKNPQTSLDVVRDESFSDVEIEKAKQGSPSVSTGYPYPIIEMSPVLQPLDQSIYPSSIKPQTYGSNQYTDSPHYLGQPSPPMMRPRDTPRNMREGIQPADGYLPDVPQQPTIQSLFHPDDGEPEYYPLNQPHYPHVLSPGHPSVGEEPKHLKKPTVYVYPVPRRPAVESHVPQLERSPSELYSYSPGTLDYGVPADGQTPTYPQLYPDGISPNNMLQYDLQSTPIQPDDSPKDVSRPHQSQPRLPGSTTHLPGPFGRQESDAQTTMEGFVVETSSEPSTQVPYTTSAYPESLPRQSVVSSVGKMVYPEPSAEQITVTSTLTYPDEHHNTPSTTTVQYPNPLGTNKLIPSGPVIEGAPEQSIMRPRSEGGAPQVPQSPHDVSRTELLIGQASSPENYQPAGEPKKSLEPIYGDSSSVNTLDFPYSTEDMRKPGSTTPPENVERGFYPDDALTTTSQTTSTGSAPDEPSTIQTAQVVMPTGTQLLIEPSNGVTDLPPQPSTLLEPGTFPVSPDSPQIPKGPSLLPDSKITRIFPVTKPTFYTDKDGQKFVSLKLLNEPISTSPTGEVIPHELTDSAQPPGTTDLVIPIGQDVSDTSTPSIPQNATQPHPMLKGIPIGNVQVFDAQTIIKVIESCNCSNLKFLIPILKRPQSAIVVANNEYPGIAN